MTIYGRSARLLRRYGPWTLVVTTATVTAALGINRSAPSEYRSEASILVEARTGADITPVPPSLATEQAVLFSDAVTLPAAQRLGVSRETLLDGLEVERVQGANVLQLVYSAGERFSARVRATALVESYLADRNGNSSFLVRVLSPATLPTTPDNRPLGPDLATGLAAGLLLGAATALVRARSRGRIRGREDFERLAGAPVLATVARTRRQPDGTPVVLHSPGSAAAESYRYLRTRLQPALHADAPTTILVTSPGDRQGRTTVASNLAATLAQAGRTVVLVDADLRRPSLHQTFQVPGEHGLTTLLDGDATVSEVLEDTPVPGLRLLPAGHRTHEHVDLLESSQLDRVLRAVQKHCDVVVLDAAAVLSASDAIALAAHSDQILLVGDFRRTSRASVRRALSELAEVVDGNLSTVLLNLPKSAGGLTPRVRESSTEPLTPTAGLLHSAEGSASPGAPSHTYPAEDQEPQLYAVPVGYSSPISSTLYSSAAAQEKSPLPQSTETEPEADVLGFAFTSAESPERIAGAANAESGESAEAEAAGSSAGRETASPSVATATATAAAAAAAAAADDDDREKAAMLEARS